MNLIDRLSTQKPLNLKYSDAVPGFVVETTVLAINRLEGTVIVVDWESGCRARISDITEECNRSTPLAYEVLRPYDSAVSNCRTVWIMIPDSTSRSLD